MSTTLAIGGGIIDTIRYIPPSSPTFINHTFSHCFFTIPLFPSHFTNTIQNKHRPCSSSSSSSPPILASSSLSDMDAVRGQGMYPLHRCKTIHLVRHAQGFHNVAGEKDHSAYMSPELFDAALTPLGWQQVDNLRKHVHSTGLSKKIELVVVSPLLSCWGFGGAGFDDGINAAPLMTENAGKSNRPAISSLNAPPFVAMELCREHLGVHWCDKRRSITEYKPLFPAIDFSLIETDEDTLWTLDVREADEDLAERGQKFLNWLWMREESEIAVVTHSGFLIHTLSAFGNDCQPPVKEEICKPFNNCELRSMVFVDRSMAATSSSKTNFPGKIPDGMDAPSEEAVAKN